MVKRAIIQFNGAVNKLRISKAGIDVDTATSDQLILDERIFYGQLYLAGYAARTQSGEATIAYQSLGYAPLCIVFNVSEGGIITYPARYRYQTGGSAFRYPSTNYRSLDGQLILNFAAAPSVIGNHYLIFRRPI